MIASTVRGELRNAFTEGFLVYSSLDHCSCIYTTHDTPIVGLGIFAWRACVIPFTSTAMGGDSKQLMNVFIEEFPMYSSSISGMDRYTQPTKPQSLARRQRRLRYLLVYALPAVLLRTRALQEEDGGWRCTRVVVGAEGRGSGGGNGWEQ